MKLVELRQLLNTSDRLSSGAVLGSLHNGHVIVSQHNNQQAISHSNGIPISAPPLGLIRWPVHAIRTVFYVGCCKV